MGWTVRRTRKNLGLNCEFRVGLRKNTLTSRGLEWIFQQCFFKRTPRFAAYSIFVGEKTLLKMCKEVTEYKCSVVGTLMFFFYTRKWNPIIMINLLSCACHTHRHMHHYTLSMSWLYSLQQTSAVVLKKIVRNENTSAWLRKSEIPIKLHSLTVLVALWTLFCWWKGKLNWRRLHISLGLRNEKTKHIYEVLVNFKWRPIYIYIYTCIYIVLCVKIPRNLQSMKSISIN